MDGDGDNDLVTARAMSNGVVEGSKTGHVTNMMLVKFFNSKEWLHAIEPSVRYR